VGIHSVRGRAGWSKSWNPISDPSSCNLTFLVPRQIPSWCKGIESYKVIDSGSHPTALSAWLSGESARHIETLDLDHVANSTFQVLKLFLGNGFHNISTPIRAVKSGWHSNPFFRGSYSYRTVDSEDHDVWAADLAAPIENQNGIPVSFGLTHIPCLKTRLKYLKSNSQIGFQVS